MDYTIEELIDRLDHADIVEDEKLVEIYDYAEDVATKLCNRFSDVIDETLPANFVCDFNDNDEYPIDDSNTKCIQRSIDIVEPYYNRYLIVGTIYFDIEFNPIFVYKGNRSGFEADHQKKMIETYIDSELTHNGTFFAETNGEFKNYLILENLLIKNYAKYMAARERLHKKNTY